MELRKKLVEYNILAGHGKSATRVEEMRRARSDAAERRDLFTDYHFVKGEQEKERRTRIADAEERLADELAKRNATKLRQEMNKRRICEGSEELRALKERLHAAQVNKQRARQMLDNELRRDCSRQEDHLIAEQMENERLEQMELVHKLELEKMKQRERVKTINQQQIAMKEMEREEAFAEYTKEKDQVNELVEKIAHEDAEEQAARAQKSKESAEMMKRFMIEQKARQEELEQQEKDELDRIEAYAAAKRAREEEEQRKKEEAAKEKERVLRKMLGVAEEKNREAAEFEFLRNELHQQELEAVARRREEMQMRKKLEDKEEMKKAYVFQMDMKEQKKQKEIEEEEHIRNQIMKKFAEDDRIEQMNEQKRRMKVQEHKREAQRLMELRRAMYEEARTAERGDEERLRAEEAGRQAVIEAERRRLLREHALHMRDFLPKGTFETQDDYDMLYPEKIVGGGIPVAVA